MCGGTVVSGGMGWACGDAINRVERGEPMGLAARCGGEMRVACVGVLEHAPRLALVVAAALAVAMQTTWRCDMEEGTRVSRGLRVRSSVQPAEAQHTINQDAG